MRLTTHLMFRTSSRHITSSLSLRRFLSTTPPTPPTLPTLPITLSSLGFKYMEESVLQTRFNAYDTNNSGTIDSTEAIQILKDARCQDTSLQAAQNTIHSINNSNTQDNLTFSSFKSAVDIAAQPVSKRVIPISGSLLLNFIGQGVQMPVLPVMARAAGLSASELGLVTGASAFARIITNVPAAKFAESYGRKPLLVFGPAIGALGMLGFATCGDSFVSFIAANSLTGIGGAMTSVGAGLYLADISTPVNRARTTAPLMVTALLGFSIGPALGGVVAETYGYHMPFYITAVGMSLGSISAMIYLPETLKKKQNVLNAQVLKLESVSKQWLDMLKIRKIQGINSVTFTTGILQGAGPVTGIIFATEILGMSMGELGIMFTVAVAGMAPASLLGAKISDTLKNRSTMMLPGLLISAATLGLQPLCTSMLPYATLVVIRSVAEGGCVMSNVSPYIIDNTTEEQRAQGMAMRNMGQDVGILVGATSMGLLSQMVGVVEAMYTCATLQTIAAVFFWERTRDV